MYMYPTYFSLPMSGGEEKENFGEVFGQRHPPLSIYIKGILERYPDGQIFKVKSSDLPCSHLPVKV